MNKQKIAQELVKLAKELTASKVTKTFNRDRDGYDEVTISVEIDTGMMGADKFISKISKATELVEAERNNIIRKFGVKTDPFNDTKVKIGINSVEVECGFATDRLATFEEIKSYGFKIL